MHAIRYDIETAARIEPTVEPFDLGSIDLPKSILSIKSDTIRLAKTAKYIEDKRRGYKTKAAKYVSKAALHWWTGRVVCICIKVDGRTHSYCNGNERRLLSDFMTDLVALWPYGVLIGKNSEEFDRPFIAGRLLAHNLGLTRHIRGDAKTVVRDIDHIFSRSRTNSQVTTLHNYAVGLGIEGKLMLGSDVAELWNEALMGDDTALQKIVTYCARDVDIVDEMLRRYEKSFELEQDVTGIPF